MLWSIVVGIDCCCERASCSDNIMFRVQILCSVVVAVVNVMVVHFYSSVHFYSCEGVLHAIVGNTYVDLVLLLCTTKTYTKAYTRLWYTFTQQKKSKSVVCIFHIPKIKQKIHDAI